MARQGTAEVQEWQQWLAKHAGLLRILYIHVHPEQEQYVAAGLRAAAVTPAAPTAGSSQPRPDVAEAAADGSRQTPQGLQLREVMFAVPPSPDLLSSISCDTLVQHMLLCSEEEGMQQQFAAALAQLTSLEELTFVTRPGDDWFRPQCFGTGLDAIAQLTRLTKLELAHLQGQGVWTQGAVDQLPTSLVELYAVMNCSTPPSSYTHLTALQRLSVHHAVDGFALPPNTTYLELEKCSNIEPLLGLQQVLSLHIWYWDLSPMGPLDGKEFQTLVADMPNLQEIHLGLQQKVGGWGNNSSDKFLGDLSEYNTPKLRSLYLVEGGLAPAGLEAIDTVHTAD